MAEKLHPELEKVDLQQRSIVLGQLRSRREEVLDRIRSTRRTGVLVERYHELCERKLSSLGVKSSPWEVVPDLMIPDYVLAGMTKKILPEVEKPCFYCGATSARHDESNCVRDLRADDSRRISWQRGFDSAKSKFKLTKEEAEDRFVQMGREAYLRFDP